MSRDLPPPTGATAGFGLEAWLIGTPADLDAAVAALAGLGRVGWHGIGRPDRRERLLGADYGRWRAYALIHLPASATGPAARPAGHLLEEPRA